MPRFNTMQEAMAAWQQDLPHLAAAGISFENGAQPLTYASEDVRYNYPLALDAQPQLASTENSSIPALLTTMIDPEVYEILFSPNNIAKIIDEVRKGTWLNETQMFPTVEQDGEVSSYGDYNENGHAGANTMWPQRQSYLYQVIKEYGQRELERAALSRVNWVAEIDKAAATIMAKYQNLTYAYGVAGLQNYGILNDPALTASLTPSAKAYGGTAWIVNGVIKATANEIYLDFEDLFLQLVNQTQGLVSKDDELIVAMSPQAEVALTATNSFNVNVSDLLKKNFPKLKIMTAVQYGVLTASNPQGLAGGNLVQMIAPRVEGQKSAYAAFNEKARAFPIIRQLSSFKQKMVGGTWGSVIRQPFAIASMLGV